MKVIFDPAGLRSLDEMIHAGLFSKSAALHQSRGNRSQLASNIGSARSKIRCSALQNKRVVPEGGFDVRSYDNEGKEIRIEVKTTIASETNDAGFWLSERERATAENDSCRRLYRVWSIDDKPQHRDFGNVVLKLPVNWQMEACGWFVVGGDETNRLKQIDSYFDR